MSLAEYGESWQDSQVSVESLPITRRGVDSADSPSLAEWCFTGSDDVFVSHDGHLSWFDFVKSTYGFV